MSHLINNELIWISIPKCASYSIEQALRNSKLKLELYDPNDMLSHYHTPLNECLETWGNKETICINRDWVDRWMSALNFIWDKIEYESSFELICKWENLDNEFLYKIMRLLKCNSIIHLYTCIRWSTQLNEIYVFCDNGRLLRPVFLLRKMGKLVSNNLLEGDYSKMNTWDHLIRGEHMYHLNQKMRNIA